MAFIPNEPVEIVSVPEWPAATERTVRLFGGERFPGMDDGAELVCTYRLDDHMHVVGHDAPREDAIASPIEMQDCVFDKARDGRILEPACSEPTVEIVVSLSQAIHQFSEAFSDSTRQAIEQSKCHELNCFG